MDLLLHRVVARFLRSAGHLQWKHWVKPRGYVDNEGNPLPDYEGEEAVAPNGWRYVIEESGGHGHGAKWNRPPIFHVQVYLGPGDRYGKYLTKDGVEQRFGKRVELPSVEVAQMAAEKHYAMATAPKETDPQKLVHMLTPAQKDIILEAYDNGGHLEPDWGTKSERPLRQFRTKMYKQLGPAGIFKNEQYLSELGMQIGKLLRGH
jgi:hypothetical protein